MKPVELNFQTRQTLVTRLMGPAMILLLLLAGTLTLLNTSTFFSNRSYIDILTNQIEQKKQTTGKRSDGSISKPYTPRQLERLQSDFQSLMRILEKDMFPLSQLLDVVETAIPKNIIINELTLSKGASSLLLKGESPDADSVAIFLNALKRSRRFSIDFNRGAVTGGKGFSFEIIAHWKRNDIQR